MIKTTDGRFIEKRVVIDNSLLKEIVLKIKEKRKLSWNQLSRRLGVCTQTLSHGWLKKGNTIPLSRFRKLLSFSDRYSFEELKEKIKIKEVFWGQKLNKKSKHVRLPDLNSKEFAEFYGIMLGDGCINSNLKGFAITGNLRLEKRYYESYLADLIFKLFDAKPSIVYSENENTIRAIFYSKKVCQFLNNAGFPAGLKKKGDLSFPNFITKSDENLAYCLRGLIDTDGSLCHHPNSKIMIHLSITSNSLKKSALEGFKKLGIKVGVFDKGIMIYTPKKIEQVFNLIGFSNFKNILKYELFLKNSRVPKSKEIEMFLRQT